MNERPMILWLEQVTQAERETVGGKGANLGEMARAGYPIPPGFCLTTFTYLDFIRQNDLEAEVENRLKLYRDGKAYCEPVNADDEKTDH